MIAYETCRRSAIKHACTVGHVRDVCISHAGGALFWLKAAPYKVRLLNFFLVC